MNSFIPFFEVIVGIILGITQGITEFLPISSTAHILIVSKLLTSGLDVGISASNIIQFGTLVAIIFYYKSEVVLVFKNVAMNLTNFRQFKRYLENSKNWLNNSNITNFTRKDYYDVVISQLLIATFPLVVFALLFRKYVESLRDSVFNIAIFLVFGGILIMFAEYLYKNKYSKEILKEDSIVDEYDFKKLFNLKQVLIVGLFQSFAIFPGISRSGSTLAGALISGKNRKDGVYFSFLLSIPAIFLASFYDFIKVLSALFKNEIDILPKFSGLDSIQGSTYNLSLFSILLGTIVSYFVGLICLKWLIKYLSVSNSKYFILYRFVIAIIIAVWFVFNK